MMEGTLGIQARARALLTVTRSPIWVGLAFADGREVAGAPYRRQPVSFGAVQQTADSCRTISTVPVEFPLFESREPPALWFVSNRGDVGDAIASGPLAPECVSIDEGMKPPSPADVDAEDAPLEYESVAVPVNRAQVLIPAGAIVVLG